MQTRPYRDVHAGTLRREDVGRQVRLAGWVNARRDHGGVVFVDLRDASGIAQVVFNPGDGAADEAAVNRLRGEFCVSLVGTVRDRTEGTVNPDLATGDIEVAATELTVLSAAAVLPFQLDERTPIDEAKRLEYRYLDLRRPRMAANLQARSRAVSAMRRVMDDKNFLEVETPTLIASTPEGARDMLVPSRLRPGHFYALPQSPQLFKQLLMVSGIERYYQFARCYRDEDFRADRQLEFTQLDLEGSFWTKEDVWEVLEELAVAATKAVRGVEPARPFPRITHAEAMERFGSDKPDIRFDMEITDISDAFAETGFKAFAAVLGSGGTIRGINAGPLGLSRSGLDGLVSRAQELGAKGLVWMVVEEDGSLKSPVAKFLNDGELDAIKVALASEESDTILIVADTPRVVLPVLGQLRVEIGAPEGHSELAYAIITDFPVFHVDDDGELAPQHHPFTAPYSVDEMRDTPESALSRAYDVVLNGTELGSGSVRIHDPEVQSQVFEVLGIPAEEAEARFGWFLEALRYGTPPHAGFAFGIDRLVSILRDEPNIREVIPFPKTQTGADPLTSSPSRVEDLQLRELGIDVRAEIKAEWGEADS